MSSTPSTLGTALLASAIALTGLLLGSPPSPALAPGPRPPAIETIETIENDDGTVTEIEIEPGQWILYDTPVPVDSPSERDAI